MYWMRGISRACAESWAHPERTDCRRIWGAELECSAVCAAAPRSAVVVVVVVVGWQPPRMCLQLLLLLLLRACVPNVNLQM